MKTSSENMPIESEVKPPDASILHGDNEGISQPAEAKSVDANKKEAATKGKTTPKSKTLRAKEKLRNFVAPCFGIPAFKLFPLMAGCVVVCAFDAMPFGISELWLIPVIALFLGYHTTQKRRTDRRAAIGIVCDKEVLAMVLKEMPAWYSFKDVETVTWLNSLLTSLWPYIDQGISDDLTNEIVPPLIKDLVPGVRLELTKLTLGSVAPKVTSIRASHASRSEVLLDLELKWASDLYGKHEIIIIQSDAKFFWYLTSFPFNYETIWHGLHSTPRNRF